MQPGYQSGYKRLREGDFYGDYKYDYMRYLFTPIVASRIGIDNGFVYFDEQKYAFATQNDVAKLDQIKYSRIISNARHRWVTYIRMEAKRRREEILDIDPPSPELTESAGRQKSLTCAAASPVDAKALSALVMISTLADNCIVPRRLEEELLREDKSRPAEVSNGENAMAFVLSSSPEPTLLHTDSDLESVA